MSIKLNIEPDFESLLPAPTESELDQMRENLKANHATFPPIYVWENHKNTILDGHNQYKLRQKLRLPSAKIKKLKFETRQEALAFAIQCQLGRRNLTESQRAMVAAKLGKLSPGKPNPSPGRDLNSANLQNYPTAAQRAEAASVSPRSVAAADKVIAEGAKPLVDAVKQGKVKVSDAAAIVELPKAKQTAALKSVERGDAKTLREAAGLKPKAKKISGGTSFDVAEIESAEAPQKRTPKSGQAGLRKKAQAAYGQLIRALDELQLSEKFEQCLEQIAKAIK